MMRHMFRTSVLACCFVTGLHTAAAADTREPDWQDTLRTVCKLSHNSGEPVCSALDEVTQDHAWLILRTACRDAKNNCQTFFARQGGVLLYDVKEDRWRAEWEQKLWPLKFDVAGVPTMRLKPKDAKPLKVIAGNVSPLTYSATPGTPKEEDLSVIAGIKTFLSLAGGGIAGLIQTVTYSPPTRIAETLPKEERDAFSSLLREQSEKRAQGRTREEPPACKFGAPPVGELAQVLADRHARYVAINTATRNLASQIDAADRARSNYVAVIQKAEDGKPVRTAELVAPREDLLKDAFTTFENAVQKLTDHTFDLTGCQPLLSAFGAVLAVPANAAVLKAIARQVQPTAECTLETLEAALVATARNLMAENCTIVGTSLEEALKLHSAAAKPLVDRLANAKQVEEKALGAVDAVVAKKPGMLSAAAALSRQIVRGQRHTWGGTLIRELILTRQNPELPWSKVQTHTIILKADTPYVKDVTLARSAEEKRDYRLESATGQILGYGIGVIYTPLQESTWAAATKPGQDYKVVTETKRESRAGDVAAFLTYRFLEHRPAKRWLQPVFDFGVGLTSDRPAFFIGPGIEITRAARVGWGWAPQRVTTLDESQIVNETRVDSSDAIKTIKRFETRNWYFSFSFALDSLSLFNKPD
jgi:hypothetical protein